MSTQNEPPRATKGVAAMLLLALCCWHAAFLVFSIIPQRAGQDDPGAPAMDAYRLATGSRQVWNMFETIPMFHSLDVHLEGSGPDGRQTTAGCVLPGFAAYPQPEQSRFYVLFHRLLLTDHGAVFREAYLKKVAGQMQSRADIPGGKVWSLVMDAEFIRTLTHSRRDGQLSLPFVKKFGPAGSETASP